VDQKWSPDLTLGNTAIDVWSGSCIIISQHFNKTYHRPRQNVESLLSVFEWSHYAAATVFPNKSDINKKGLENSFLISLFHKSFTIVIVDLVSSSNKYFQKKLDFCFSPISWLFSNGRRSFSQHWIFGAHCEHQLLRCNAIFIPSYAQYKYCLR